jgi:isopentenyl diphosphate isomerase/L-lactate dehydrogenase-like FMN-dependent dehydrogenase
MVKALALGADAIAMGRPFLISSYAYWFAEHIIERELYRRNLLMRLISGFFSPNGKSESFVLNFIESVATECKILTSAVGKYDVRELAKEDLGALNRKVAEMFAVEYIYANA